MGKCKCRFKFNDGICELGESNVYNVTNETQVIEGIIFYRLIDKASGGCDEEISQDSEIWITEDSYLIGDTVINCSSYVQNSVIKNSQIDGCRLIKDSFIEDSTLVATEPESSCITGSTLNKSLIKDSKINRSDLINCKVLDSYINASHIGVKRKDCSIVEHSEVLSTKVKFLYTSGGREGNNKEKAKTCIEREKLLSTRR